MHFLQLKIPPHKQNINPTKKTITKAMDIEPTSPEKHFAFILELKKLKTDKAINKTNIR